MYQSWAVSQFYNVAIVCLTCLYPCSLSLRSQYQPMSFSNVPAIILHADLPMDAPMCPACSMI